MTINFAQNKQSIFAQKRRLEKFSGASFESDSDEGNNSLRASAPDMSSKPIGEHLIEMGSTSPEKLDAALAFQKRKGGLLGETMLRMGMISKDQLQTALGIKHGMLRPGTSPDEIPYNLIMAKRPISSLAEEFRGIRTRLVTTLSAEEVSMFSVASVEARSDADYIATNLAAAFAQLGQRTLIVDADLRVNRMGRFFKLQPDTTLNSVLCGDADLSDAVVPTLVNNLHVVCSGGPTNISQELLAGDNFPAVLDQAADEFDIIVVLSAPFNKVTDGQLVWTRTKKTFVAVRKNHDKVASLKKMNTIIRQVGADVVGVALTK